jgi:hypothetical protein
MSRAKNEQSAAAGIRGAGKFARGFLKDDAERP